jgi:outer membrane lipoprotein-sorting protein
MHTPTPTPGAADSRRRHAARVWLVCVLALAAGACGRKAPSFPSGGGAAFPDFAAAYQQATASCRDTKTMTASLALSGKAARTKLRGRIDAGFAAPAKMRLEGRAPFGRPVFVLTADGGRATLVLPRDERVLADAPPEQVVEALAGIALTPDMLRTIVAGCGVSTDPPSAGQLYGGGQAAVTLGSGTAYLRRAGSSWQLVGGARAPLTVVYGDFRNGLPTMVRLRTGTAADLTLRLSQVEINASLDPKAFEATPPERAAPLTLEELRRAGPLGEGAKE